MVFFLCQRVRIKVTKFILMPVPASKQIYITCCVLKCATKFSSHISELRCVLVFREAILFITFLADSLLNRLFSNRIKITGLYLPKRNLITHISITEKLENVCTEIFSRDVKHKEYVENLTRTHTNTHI